MALWTGWKDTALHISVIYGRQAEKSLTAFIGSGMTDSLIEAKEKMT